MENSKNNCGVTVFNLLLNLPATRALNASSYTICKTLNLRLDHYKLSQRSL